MKNPITYIWHSLTGKRMETEYEPARWQTRAGRHARLDMNKLRKRRAKAKAGRKQRLLNQRLAKK